jgi:UDP-2-acetamido-3-amino-2,3-dideoxy-glucuronate N-acetyltransferase
VSQVFVHSKAICESTHVGEDTRIWAFAHVLPGARIGKNCNICDGVFIENDVVIGDDVTIKSGVQLWDGSRIGHRVFIGPNAAFTNDRFPRSKKYPDAFVNTVIEEGASIGANATILPGVVVGAEAMIGAGAVVSRDVPPRAVVTGNPASVVDYVGAIGIDAANQDLPADCPCRIQTFTSHSDRRGRLSVFQEPQLPFAPLRVFIVDQVERGHARGSHAHRHCKQLLVAARGTIVAAVDDGKLAYAVRLSSPTVGLYVPERVWGLQFGHTPDAALLVLASDPYDESDFIRYFREFIGLTADR